MKPEELVLGRTYDINGKKYIYNGVNENRNIYYFNSTTREGYYIIVSPESLKNFIDKSSEYLNL